MKLKKYGKGGKYDMYYKGGPVKAKKMSKEELERDAAMAKERLEELAGEKAYLAKRKEADRQYRMALKEGATEEQATKIAEKYLRMYLKGGQVKPKKKITLVEDTLEEVDVVSELPRKESGAIEKPSLLDAVKYSLATKTTAKDWESKQHPAMKATKITPNMGNPPIEAVPFAMPVKGVKQLPRVLDALLELYEYDRDKKYKHGGKIKKYLKGGQVKLDANKDGKISGEDFKILKAKKK